jgi:hypothetical protein
MQHIPLKRPPLAAASLLLPALPVLASLLLLLLQALANSQALLPRPSVYPTLPASLLLPALPVLALLLPLLLLLLRALVWLLLLPLLPLQCSQALRGSSAAGAAMPAVHSSGTLLAPHGTALAHLQQQRQRKQQQLHAVESLFRKWALSWLLMILHWHTCNSSNTNNICTPLT